MNDWCLVWSRERNELMVARQEAAENLNFGRFLDDEPGECLLRSGLTRDQAERLVRAYSGVLAKRETVLEEA